MIIQLNAHHYSTWASLACDYLAIMGSSVSSERAFSAAGIVFESPVKSGFLLENGWTETETGLHQFKDSEKPDRTDMDQSTSVLCGFLWFKDRSQLVAVLTS